MSAPRHPLRVLGVAMAMYAAACAHRTAPPPGPILLPGAQPGAVWQLTYLKATDSNRDRLATYITRNWFVMDARAKREGYLVDNHLLRGHPSDTTWDLLEIAIYADSAQHARIDSIFRTIIRPQHRTELVDGLTFPQLGRVVREETLRWTAKSR